MYVDWYLGAFLYRRNVLRHIDGEGAKFRKFLDDIIRVYAGPDYNGIRANRAQCQCPDCLPPAPFQPQRQHVRQP